MKHTIYAAALLAFLSTATASAQPGQEPGWSVRLTGASLLSTANGSFDSSLGYGLGVEYRASRRLGVEIGVVSGEFNDEIGFDFFDEFSFSIRSSLRATPILAQLDIHLTPDSRVDLFLGPVVGYVTYGDRETRIRGFEGETIPVVKIGTDDGFAWGVHLGLDVPLGQSSAFMTFGATYLQAEVGTDAVLDETGNTSFDLDPLVIQAGFGYSF